MFMSPKSIPFTESYSQQRRPKKSHLGSGYFLVPQLWSGTAITWAPPQAIKCKSLNNGTQASEGSKSSQNENH